jgi:TonB family protein
VDHKPALPVEIGAFQAPVSNATAAVRTVTKIGAFDGEERRTGETNAPTVTVAAAAFGNAPVNHAVAGAQVATEGRSDAGFGLAVSDRQPVETKPAVRTGGFDSSVAAAAAPPQRQMEQTRTTEVEILFKPRPAYTEDARQLRIEGVVLVNVVFTASGEVKVLGVEKGLGHGLDEAAAQAAAKIRFKPAKRGDMAVDSTAVARITFQLAY